MSPKLYTLMCPGCGKTYKHIKKVLICPVCKSTAVVPVLSDEQCEEILKNDGDKPLPKAHVKPEKDTSDRPPEDGGRTF